MHATILLAHGSRDPQWKRPVEAVAARMRELDPLHTVGCAYIENMQPDLLACVESLAAQEELRSIRIFPLFLGAGKHVREDIGELANSVRQRHPNLAVQLITMMGDHPEFTNLLAQLALTAKVGKP